jgi:hypothetical protein
MSGIATQISLAAEILSTPHWRTAAIVGIEWRILIEEHRKHPIIS